MDAYESISQRFDELKGVMTQEDFAALASQILVEMDTPTKEQLYKEIEKSLEP